MAAPAARVDPRLRLRDRRGAELDEPRDGLAPAVEPRAARAVVDEIGGHVADVDAVLVEVAEHVRDRVPYLPRAPERLLVVALGEDLAPPRPEAIEALPDADPERA
jgi:hypothetical protein